ncbi:hypothetical protein Phi4:1_gp072 [Cellulophaga phage phi4:1]|uniref:Uncharacterized protein n=3 Tax=Lightbulbvirus Cba41 TaxID=1918524 RepID=A0A0S2MWI7_9CAUD|nr:hypothetical protein Phi4:1_gp072 [Cellulophaga phage phi4:1]AGO49485.1 hypothetical protein Phi4:1_gp072 [Cellulophaga phage phi4:1]ALO80081.1 hypothetical protein Phi4113_072 [Cellulophaga phage phi4:1_13]ALO80278.1 hypothetical protein Phi4118_072 [Cellulophaga phage phi4:1_18]
MDTAVKFHEELIDEVSKELGLDYKEVEEIIKLDIAFIKSKAKDPKTTSIYVGKNLGTLYCNLWKLGTEIKDKEKSPVKEYKIWSETIFRPRKNILEEFIKTLPEDKKHNTKYTKKPFIYLLKRKLKKKLDFNVNVTRNPDRLWSKIAEIQNKENE